MPRKQKTKKPPFKKRIARPQKSEFVERIYTLYHFAGRDPVVARLNTFRQAFGFDDRKIAELSGLPKQTVTNFFNKTIYPRFATVARIAMALDQGDMPLVEQQQKPPSSYKAKHQHDRPLH